MRDIKKLEELLPLYIGRKVLIDSGAHKLIGAEGTLVGKTDSRALVQHEGEILEVEFVDIKLILKKPHISMSAALYYYQNGALCFISLYNQYDTSNLIEEGLAVDANDYK